jgi:hypothetical protein
LTPVLTECAEIYSLNGNIDWLIHNRINNKIMILEETLQEYLDTPVEMFKWKAKAS